eukprot:8007548-Pyramimonas_sp.AAC.1
MTGEGGGDPGGREDDQRDDQSTATRADMIAAMHFDETGEPKAPRGPPGGLGGGGDPDGDGGGGPNGHNVPTWQPFIANQVGVNWRSFGNKRAKFAGHTECPDTPRMEAALHKQR